MIAILPFLIAGAATMAGQYMANRANRNRAREQMAFQERMSGSAYQRSMRDMRLAGLNPMLAYQQGGASTPGGAMPREENVMGAGVSSAMQAVRLKQEVRLMKKEGVLKDQQAHAATQAGNLSLAHAKVLNYGPNKFGPSYAAMTAYQTYLQSKAQARVTALGIPAAGIRGSKTAGVIRLLSGGIIPAAAAALVTRKVIKPKRRIGR